MKKNIAVYAGTFDPVTNGHLDIIERASRMFDTIYVTILGNFNKIHTFTLDERIQLLKESTKQFDNVVVDFSDKLAVEYAKEIGAITLVRGLRATMDFEYELQMALANQHLSKEVEMVFLMTKAKNTFLSSSIVKEIAMHNRSTKGLAPECVSKALKNKYSNKEVNNEK